MMQKRPNLVQRMLLKLGRHTCRDGAVVLHAIEKKCNTCGEAIVEGDLVHFLAQPGEIFRQALEGKSAAPQIVDRATVAHIDTALCVAALQRRIGAMQMAASVTKVDRAW